MDMALWSAARAGGVVAFALITASVALGLALSLKLRLPGWARPGTTEVHRYVSLLALSFVGVHVLSMLLDTKSGIGLVQVLVPFTGSQRTLAAGLGVVALDLALAVWVTTLLRRRIGQQRWRSLHMLAFGVYGVALVHGLLGGSDTRQPWVAGVYVVSACLVGGLIALRLVPPRESARPVRADPEPPPVRNPLPPLAGR
jgi:methionine sulfoxide reductase heme-binding subunit